MKKFSDGDMRCILGFLAFFVMIVMTVRAGILLKNFEYMELMTIMLAGFIAGGRR